MSWRKRDKKNDEGIELWFEGEKRIIYQLPEKPQGTKGVHSDYIIPIISGCHLGFNQPVLVKDDIDDGTKRT
jgi:hypothetical protein